MLLLDSFTAGTTNSLINALQNYQHLDKVTEQVMSQMVTVASFLAIFLYLINLGWNYISHSVKNLTGSTHDGFFSIQDLIRSLVIIMCIFSYSIIIKTTTSGIDFFNSLSEPRDEQQKAFKQYGANYLKSQTTYNSFLTTAALQKAVNDPDLEDWKKKLAQEELDKRQNQDNGDIKTSDSENVTDPSNENSSSILNLLNPCALVTTIFGQLTKFITSVITIIVGGLAMFLFKFLICVGPLAFAFSILPAYRNQVDIWFGTYLNCGFVFTTIHILDHILYALIGSIMADPAFGNIDEGICIILNCVIIILYLMPFWITSKFIGKGDAGRFVSKTIMMATAATGLVAGAASKGISSQLQNAAHSTKDAFRNNES